MASPTYTSALIVGAGQGLSASLTRTLRKEGLAVAIAARDTAKLAPLCAETGARAFSCDAQDEAQVQRLFADIDREHGAHGFAALDDSERSGLMGCDAPQLCAIRPFAVELGLRPLTAHCELARAELYARQDDGTRALRHRNWGASSSTALTCVPGFPPPGHSRGRLTQSGETGACTTVTLVTSRP